MGKIGRQLCDNELEPLPQDIKQSIAEKSDEISINDDKRLHFQSTFIKQAIDLLPRSLHRLNDNINVVLVGPPHSGKTALANNLYGDEVDVPDQTKAILRLPFANGFTLWDTPGSYPMRTQILRALGLDSNNNTGRRCRILISLMPVSSR